MKPVIFYGQNREDLILDAFFAEKKTGFYVDVGAYDPVFESVTKLFYDRGWKGVNIEPQVELFKRLKRQRKRDINLQMGVADAPGTLTLRSYESAGLSTFSSTMKDSYKKTEAGPYKDYEVPIDTLKNIFTAHKIKHIDFLKVDVEGLEYEVLAGNDWQKFRPEVICIEANHIVKDWRPFLRKQNYELSFFDGLNEYYVAKEVQNRSELFRKSYPEKLVAAPTLSYGWAMQVDLLRKQLNRVQRALNHTVAQTGQRISTLEQQVAAARAELQKHESPRFLAKKIARKVKERVKSKKS